MMMHLQWTTIFLAAVLLIEVSLQAAETPGPPNAERVEFYENYLAEKPRGVGAPITDRKAWEDLAQQSKESRKIIEKAEELLKTPMPELTDELYLEYFRTGKRDSCQKVIFARRNRLRVLALAECFENKGRFVPALEATIRSLGSEKSWQYPAHDVGLKVFKGEKQDIDLATSNHAWQLATAKYWLGEKLSPETRKTVYDELERRIFTPFTGMMNKGEPWIRSMLARGNHNAVDLAGLTGAALAEIESKERRAFFAASAEKYIEYFLSGFTPDGNCSEGVGYWGYGFGHYVMLAETIKQATGGKVDWMSQERLMPIALYPRRIEILPGVFPAFADCDINPHPDQIIMDYLNRRYGWGLEKYDHPGGIVSKTVELENSLFEIGVFNFPNSVSGLRLPKKPAEHALRDWFSDAGVFIGRPRTIGRRALGVALKGGHNAEQHNHNDLGSLVVALGKSTPIVDPGPEIYTSRTFTPRRYESNVLNSFGHSVPRVAGKLQSPGKKAHAEILKTEFTDAADTLVMDLSSAYPIETLEKLTRTFVFSREGAGKLTVTDEVKFSEPEDFGAALITLDKWKQLGPQRLQIGEGAEAVQAEFVVDGGEVRLDPQEIKEDTPENRVPIRLGLDFTKPVKKGKITVMITPAE